MSLFREIDHFFSRFMPPVTRRFFYALWLVYMAQILFGGLFEWLVVLRPATVFPFVWQLGTYGFLHSGFGHIFGNTLALLFFGGIIENAMGGRRYTLFLLVAVMFAGLVHTGLFWGAALVQGNAAYLGTGAVGFSAAVFAILVGCLFVAPNITVHLYFLFPMKLKLLVIFFLVFEVLYLVSGGLHSPISHVGHLAGAAVGFAAFRFPSLWRLGERRPRRGGRVVRSSRVISMGHPGRSKNADSRYDDPHWKMDQ